MADAIVVGTVSRVSVEKGHKHLIDAIAQLAPRPPQLRALIVGDGPAKADLQDQTARLGLQGVILFPGFCDALSSTLAAMDIFAQPSVQQEGLPTSVLEAQAAALPVIASDIGGTNEALEANVTGLLTPPGDAAALAHAIEQLAADPERRHAMGIAGRTRIQNTFTIEAMVQQVASAYEEALARHAQK